MVDEGSFNVAVRRQSQPLGRSRQFALIRQPVGIPHVTSPRRPSRSRTGSVVQGRHISGSAGRWRSKEYFGSINNHKTGSNCRITVMVDVLMMSLKIALAVLYRFSMFCHHGLDFYRNLDSRRASLQDRNTRIRRIDSELWRSQDQIDVPVGCAGSEIKVDRVLSAHRARWDDHRQSAPGSRSIPRQCWSPELRLEQSFLCLAYH